MRGTLLCMTYDFTRRMDEIATWYRSVLATHHPAGADREAKELLLTYRDRFAMLAAQGAAPAAGVAAVQWNRVILVLAETERELGRPGWRPAWVDVDEHFVLGDDVIHGPFGPTA